MIDHTGIRVNNMALSRTFYVSALSPLGMCILHESESSIGFGAPSALGDPGGSFWLTPGEPHRPRTHVGFRAPNRLAVSLFFDAAISAGGISNGAPGMRPQYHKNYFAAFVLDPDGYNIEAVIHL